MATEAPSVTTSPRLLLTPSMESRAVPAGRWGFHMSSRQTVQWLLLVGGAAWLAVAGEPAEGAELRISHAPRSCVLSGQFARVEARLEPSSDAARARVLFRKDGEPLFYEVPMRREGELFVGVLPSPAAEATRIAYYLSAEAGTARARAPQSSVYLADVVATPCAEGAFPVSASGPAQVGVPAGAPQAPPGFERRGIAAFVALEGEPASAAAPGRASSATPMAVAPIPLGSKVRVITRPGQQKREGRLASFDGETLSLETKDAAPVRIPRERLVSLEVREPDSPGMRVLGGLAGGVAGLAVTLLVCASGDSCDSVGVAWLGFGVGTAVGAAVTGGGGWKPVTLATAGPVALDLRPRPAGAGAELRVGF